MRKTRIILIAIAVLLVVIIYLLPKSVVENESQLQQGAESSTGTSNPHTQTPEGLRKDINRLRARYLSGLPEEKNAIFADSLVGLYSQAGLFDSAAWFAEKAATFFKTDESLLKAGNAFYEAYSFAVDRDKQNAQAEKSREYFGMIVEKNPGNLEVKTKMAMTYLSSGSPMKGISMLREVIAADPKNELALFNMGMLSVQSGQYDKAIEWLEKLATVNEKHLQGQLLLGIAYMNSNQNEKARQQFEKVKKMDSDPSVQATVDSYLKELK
ncbi:MAG TPA: tetratricopeptide repeat protein [Cyclobacteriaceae bacterium]|nr:tetratricopeptide repeat protein [Cyclobacteriaceae bacterium]